MLDSRVVKKLRSEDVSNIPLSLPRTREEQFGDLESNPEFDVLIVGGGATGAGALLSASRRGLRALLVESHDFGAATSSKSTKLLHGGLRYLDRVFSLHANDRRSDLKLVVEALEERDLLVNNAPLATDSVGIVIPCEGIFSAGYFFAGCMVYHGLSRLLSPPDVKNLGYRFPFPRLLFGQRLKDSLPGLGSHYKYGVVTFDGQMDDSALLAQIFATCTAERPGFTPSIAMNYTRLEGFRFDEKGRIEKAVIREKTKGKLMEVKVKTVVNAAGSFGDQVRHMANPELKPVMRLSKGDHLVVDLEGILTPKRSDDNIESKIIRRNTDVSESPGTTDGSLPSGDNIGSLPPTSFRNKFQTSGTSGGRMGILIPRTRDGRVIFGLPWRGSMVLGTSDIEWSEPVVDPLPDASSAEQIISEVRRVCPEATLRVRAHWAGLRPLVMADPKGLTKDALRVHYLESDPKSGLISVLGGKWTIFRRMGEEAIDRVLIDLKERGLLTPEEALSKSALTTRNARLSNDPRPIIADPTKPQPPFSRVEWLRGIGELAGVKFPNSDSALVEYLISNYGLHALKILEDIQSHPEKGESLLPGTLFTPAEIEYLAKYQFATFPYDAITRRLRIAFTDSRLAEELLPSVVDVYGNMNGWNDEKRKEEFEFNREVLRRSQFDFSTPKEMP